MLTIGTLEKTDTSILYEIRPGKPDPNQPCQAGEDTRGRVYQKSSDHAWYGNFNLLRNRIGKHPSEEFKDDRAIEATLSSLRKKTQDFTGNFPIKWKEAFQYADKLRSIDKTKAQEHLADPGPKIEDYRSYIEDFITQEKYLNLYDYLQHRKSNGMLYFNLAFLLHYPCTLAKMAADSYWQNGSIFTKHKYSDFVIRELAAKLYGLHKSVWKPEDGIDGLINELKSKGPLAVTGYIGVHEYKERAEKFPEQIGGRDIYGWRRGVARDSIAQLAQMTLIVGAKKTEKGGAVFFIDVLADPSDPKDPSVQKIYAISMKNFTSNICNLAGIKHVPPISSMDPKDNRMVQSINEYAYYGNFKIN